MAIEKSDGGLGQLLESNSSNINVFSANIPEIVITVKKDNSRTLRNALGKYGLKMEKESRYDKTSGPDNYVLSAVDGPGREHLSEYIRNYFKKIK